MHTILAPRDCSISLQISLREWALDLRVLACAVSVASCSRCLTLTLRRAAISQRHVVRQLCYLTLVRSIHVLGASAESAEALVAIKALETLIVSVG